MNRASLAIRYRPQTFAQVVGQETIRAILSRAAAENQVASAYLLSGTRGVGKTTLARIFAKALNCEHAPTAEPCNQCEACKRITLGNHVDVVEIDGASNRGIDDARRLRETIGYAPMEGRYKVFIIDEAHMLTRDAFNALLKTLEEPPAGVTFILATTEPHKFPVTIVSRCQHFVFKRLPEIQIITHLGKVLEQEAVSYDDAALRLIAKRAAGSVRDAMSLLGQSLALGEERLTEQGTRTVLGLAGQEIFVRLLDAFARQDTLAVASLVREVLDQGIDLGFFLRELASLWRTLFMLNQLGTSIDAQKVLDISAEEAQIWSDYARRFDLAHIHAAWQMVLDGQRRVLNSLEPSASLELLLLHLALLPRLIGLERLNGSAKNVTPQATPSSAAGASGAEVQSVSGMDAHEAESPLEKKKSEGLPASLNASFVQESSPAANSSAFDPVGSDYDPVFAPDFEGDSPEDVDENDVERELCPEPQKAVVNWQDVTKSWQEFYTFCAQSDPAFFHLRSVRVQQNGTCLELECTTTTLYEQLSRDDRGQTLQRYAREYYGKALEIRLKAPCTTTLKTYMERQSECEQHPTTQKLKALFGARFSRVLGINS